MHVLCYLPGMSRTVIAFTVAPLWVPLIVSSLTAAPPVSDSLATHWWVLTGLVSWFFAYLGAFGLGVPASCEPAG